MEVLSTTGTVYLPLPLSPTTYSLTYILILLFAFQTTLSLLRYFSFLEKQKNTSMSGNRPVGGRFPDIDIFRRRRAHV